MQNRNPILVQFNAWKPIDEEPNVRISSHTNFKNLEVAYIASIFKRVARNASEHEQMQLDAVKGDPFALACLGAAAYQGGTKTLAFEYFKAATDSIANVGDGKLEHAIATLISDSDSSEKLAYYLSAIKKGFAQESVEGIQKMPSDRIKLQSNPNAGSSAYSVDMNYFHGVLKALSIKDAAYNIPINDSKNRKPFLSTFVNRVNDLRQCYPEKFKELFIQYPLETWKKVHWTKHNESEYNNLFNECQKQLIEEIIISRITEDNTATEKHKLYNSDYYEGLEEKIQKRLQNIESVHAPAAIKAIETTVQESIDTLLSEFNNLLKKDGNSLPPDINLSPMSLEQILNAGEESLQIKYDSKAAPRLAEDLMISRSDFTELNQDIKTVEANQYSVVAEMITNNPEMQSIFLQLRAFKKVQTACAAPRPISASETSTDSHAAPVTTETRHLINILKAVNDATEKMKSTQTHNKDFKESLQKMHWVQWVASLSVIGIPLAMLHSKVMHGTIWYGSHQEKHAARKQRAANQAFNLFSEKTKYSVNSAKHIPVVGHGAKIKKM